MSLSLNNLMCVNCNQRRGAHSASSYHCPLTEGGYHKTQKFKLNVRRLSDDAHMVNGLRKRSVREIEREVARNVIKQLEQQLGLLGFNREITQAEVLDGINLIRNGYDL